MRARQNNDLRKESPDYGSNLDSCSIQDIEEYFSRSDSYSDIEDDRSYEERTSNTSQDTDCVASACNNMNVNPSQIHFDVSESIELSSKYLQILNTQRHLYSEEYDFLNDIFGVSTNEKGENLHSQQPE